MKTFSTSDEKRRKQQLAHTLIDLLIVPIRLLVWFYFQLGGAAVNVWFDRRADRKFARDIERELALFLGEDGLKIEALPAWRYRNVRYLQNEEAVIVTPDVRLRFSKWRNELSLSVASPTEPNSWISLGDFTQWRDGRVGNREGRLSDDSLPSAAQLIHQNWNRLVEIAKTGEQP